MKNIYIYLVTILAVLVFSACSNGDDNNDEYSSSAKGGSKLSSSSKGATSGPDSKSGACYLTFTGRENYLNLCAEGISRSVTRSDCDAFLEEMNADPDMPNAFTAEFMNSCPSGQRLKCEGEDEEVFEGTLYMYAYGSGFRGATCEDIMGDDEDDEPSSSSAGGTTRPSSSSKGSQGGDQGYCIFDDYYGTEHYCQEIPSDYDVQSCIDMGGRPVNSCPTTEPSSSSASNPNSGGACYSYFSEYWEETFCLEPVSSSECTRIGMDFGNPVSFQTSSCQPGYRYKCNPINGVDVYLYGDDAEPSDCEDFFE